MGTYYYIKDPDDDNSLSPIYEDDYINALYSIAKKHGIHITDEMIRKELKNKKARIQNHQKNKTYLYIDGTNLFAGQNELFNYKKLLSFNFLLEEINKLIKIDQVFFYASYINRNKQQTTKYKNIITAEALFYNEVKNNDNVLFYKGHRSPSSGKEKGVDVHLAVDIVKDIFFGRCQKVVIMSGDADLIYPLEIVKSLDIPTYAIFLSNRFSLEMAYKVKRAYVLNFINKFKVHRKLPKHLGVIDIKKPRMINMRGR